jgi:hypothetical protein
MLTADDFNRIQNIFSMAVGIHVLFYEYAMVLFKNKKDMVHTWEYGMPSTIGGLQVGYMISKVIPSTAVAESGHGLSGYLRILPSQRGHRSETNAPRWR